MAQLCELGLHSSKYIGQLLGNIIHNFEQERTLDSFPPGSFQLTILQRLQC